MEKGSDISVDLIGCDGSGAPLRKEVPSGAEVAQEEATIRHGGGRVMRAEVRRARSAPAAISSEDFARFNEMLGDAVKRKLPLPDGMRSLCLQSRDKRFRRSVEEMAARLDQGMPLTRALDVEGSAFPPFYGRLLKAGAAAGNLSEVLLNLSRNVRLHVAFRRALLSNVIYPLLLLAVVVALLAGAGLTLVPWSFVPAADKFGVAVPTLTEFMTGQTVQSRATLAALALILLGGAILWSRLRHTVESSRMADEVARGLPYLRSFYEAALWSNAADIMALLMRAQVPAPEAFRLAGDALGRPWVSEAMNEIAERIERGESIGAAADGVRSAPRRFARAVLTADISGGPVEKLEALAAEYRNEAERRAENFIRYFPSVAAVTLGALVMAVAFALLQPYFGLWWMGL